MSFNKTDLRRRALKRLQNQTDNDCQLQSKFEIQRLYYELQVHEIELDMQNQELQNMRSELEAQLADYVSFYAFAPVGYFILNSDGTVSQTNLRGAQLLDFEPNQLQGKQFIKFVCQDDQANFKAFLQRVFSTASLQTCKLKLEKLSQPAQMLQIEACFHPNTLKCYLIAINAT